MWCLSAQDLVGTFILENTVNGAVYLNLLQENIMPSEQFENEDYYYFQQDGAPFPYHCNVKTFYNENLPN